MKYLNILLVSIFAVGCSQPHIEELEPIDFAKALDADNNKVIVDVRTSNEFMMKHLYNAVNVDLYSHNFEAEITALDKTSNVYVYDKSGVGSKRAAKMLGSQGYENIFLMKGGLISWERAGLPLVTSKRPAQNKVYTMDEYNELVADPDQIVLVDFMADWCGPCKQMAPGIESLKAKHEGRLKVVKINIDHNQELAQKYQVYSIPVVKVYKAGDLVYDQVGYHSEEQLSNVLTPLF